MATPYYSVAARAPVSPQFSNAARIAQLQRQPIRRRVSAPSSAAMGPSAAGGGGGRSAAPQGELYQTRLYNQEDRAPYYAAGGAIVGGLLGYFLGGRRPLFAAVGAAVLGGGAYAFAAYPTPAAK